MEREAKLTALAGKAKGGLTFQAGGDRAASSSHPAGCTEKLPLNTQKRTKSGSGHRGALWLQDADVCLGTLRIFQSKLSRRSEECASPENHPSGKKLQRRVRSARFKVFSLFFLSAFSALLITAPAANGVWSPVGFQVSPFIPKPFGTDEINQLVSEKTSPKLLPLTLTRCPEAKRASV